MAPYQCDCPPGWTGSRCHTGRLVFLVTWLYEALEETDECDSDVKHKGAKVSQDFLKLVILTKGMEV